MTRHSEQLRPVPSFLRKTSMYLSCLYLMRPLGWSPGGTLLCKARHKAEFPYVHLYRVSEAYGRCQTAASRNWCCSSQNRSGEGKAPTSVFILGKGWDLVSWHITWGLIPCSQRLGVRTTLDSISNDIMCIKNCKNENSWCVERWWEAPLLLGFPKVSETSFGVVTLIVIKEGLRRQLVL